MQQPTDIGMMTGNTHNHEYSRPDDYAWIHVAEEKGKNEKSNDQEHASDRNVSKQCNNGNSQRNTYQRINRETKQHHTAGGRNSFTALKAKEHRPIMSDNTTKPGQQGCKANAVMNKDITGYKPGKPASQDSFDCIKEESNQAILPAHRTLYIAGSCTLASYSMKIRTVCQFGGYDPAGQRTQQIGNDTCDQE